MENTNPRSYDEVVFTTFKDLIKNCEDKHDQLEKLQEKLQEVLAKKDLGLGDADDDDSRLDSRPTEPEQKGEEFDPYFESSPVSWPDRQAL